MARSQSGYEVIIAGGGAAGLSAALALARALRNTLVVDEGIRRNSRSHALHGFLSRDGSDPNDLHQIAREQLTRYATVKVMEGRVETAHMDPGRVSVQLSDGSQFGAKILVLATGMVDELPAMEGLAAKWGVSVFHCRYCDGCEVQNRPLALLPGGANTVDQGVLAALQLTRFSHDLVWCTGGQLFLDEPTRRRLAAHGVEVREEPILHLEGEDGRLERIVFTEGPPLPREAAFIETRRRQHSDLAQQLGCEFLADGAVKVNDAGETSVPTVYAVGDMARRPPAQVVLAAASGAAAALAIDARLLRLDLGGESP